MRPRRWTRRHLLLGLQVLLNIGLPIHAWLYFAQHAEHWGLATWLPLLGAGLLTLIFVAVLQLVSVLELDPAMDSRRLATGIGLPVLIAGIPALLFGITPAWFLFELGVLYTAAIVTAYTALVFPRPFRNQNFSLRGDLGASLLQLVFIVPGWLLVLAYALLYLAASRAGELPASPWLTLMSALLALLPLTLHEYRWMSRASVAKPATAARADTARKP